MCVADGGDSLSLGWFQEGRGVGVWLGLGGPLSADVSVLTPPPGPLPARGEGELGCGQVGAGLAPRVSFFDFEWRKQTK